MATEMRMRRFVSGLVKALTKCSRILYLHVEHSKASGLCFNRFVMLAWPEN